jgi:hypothetical protein
MAAHNERAANPCKIAFDFISETTLRRNQSARKLPPELPLARTPLYMNVRRRDKRNRTASVSERVCVMPERINMDGQDLQDLKFQI